jgi:VWFA-related protein
MRARSLSALLVAYLILVAHPAAQDPPPQTFRVGAEMVVVDLVATTASGAFIQDLQPSEIQLTEDGKPQKIEFLRLVRGSDGVDTGAAPFAAPAPTTPAGAAAPAPTPASADGALVILVDLGSMPIDALPRVRTAIHALLKEDLPAGVPITLATVSQSLKISPFTTDRAAVDAAVDALPAATTTHLSLLDILEHLDMVADTAGDPLMAAMAQGRRLIAENRLRLLAISESLTLLSRSLSARQGRKQVVLYSAGYFVDATEDIIEALSAALSGLGARSEDVKRVMELRSRDRDALSAMQAAIDRANRAQVSFYAVDPRGLFAPAPGADRRISARMVRSDASRLAAMVETRSQEYLRNVSAGTGGQSYLNNNDMKRGLRRAWLDSSEYYLLGYVPSATRKKGQFHKIDLRIGRPNVSARYRQGYYEATDQEIIEADITSALRQPELYPDQDLRVEARVESGTLKVSALIPPAKVRFTETGDAHQATFSIHAALRDVKGTIVGGKQLFGRDVSINLKAERFAALMGSDSIEIPTDAKAPPPGTYQLAVVVRDSSGWIAARAVDLTVRP